MSKSYELRDIRGMIQNNVDFCHNFNGRGQIYDKKNCNKSEHMLNKFSNKNNKFTKYREHTVLLYNHGDAKAAHVVFKLHTKLHACVS